MKPTNRGKDVLISKTPDLGDIERIIEMAWEDRTPFEAIRGQFGLRESDVKELMRQNMKPGSYKRWRERVKACGTKHAQKRPEAITRFKSSLQRNITLNKISKRDKR